MTHTYDADGLEHETGFFGLPGQSAARSDGVQRIVQSFDDHGNPMAIRLSAWSSIHATAWSERRGSMRTARPS
jgi:hypothetical protein